jgi:TPR repeat protein
LCIVKKICVSHYISIISDNAGTQFKLAECYRNGIDVKYDREKAFTLYTTSANFGNKDAIYSLAKYYYGCAG